MSVIFSILFVLVVLILGYAVLPMLSTVVSMALIIALRPISKTLGYFVGRYVSFALWVWALIEIIGIGGDRFNLVTWPAWVVAAFCVVSGGNTLVLFDCRCYMTQSGVFGPGIARGEGAA